MADNGQANPNNQQGSEDRLPDGTSFEDLFRGLIDDANKQSQQQDQDNSDNEDVDDDDDQNNDIDDNEDEDVEDEDDDDSEDSDEEEEEEEKPQPKKHKKEQSPEERRRQAAKRREEEFQKRLDAELAKRMADAPETKMINDLARSMNTTPAQVLEVMRTQQYQQEAQRRNLPVEVIKEQHEMREQLNKLQYQTWKNAIDAQLDSAKKEYPMLTEDDLNSAVTYQLTTLKNPELPLENAIMALHGKKILDGLKKGAKQADLAEKGGRKRSPLPPQNGKPSSKAPKLSADELEVAKAFGMTPEDWLKYK